MNTGMLLRNRLFRIIGSVLDLPKSSIDTIIVVILGQIDRSDHNYMRIASTKLPGPPHLETIEIEQTLEILDDEDFIRNEIVNPILEIIKHK